MNTIEFSSASDATLPMIKCRTSDGLELDLEASLQYRVIPDKIYDIYTLYGNQERAILTRIVVDVISDTAAGYTARDFFTQRSKIQNVTEQNLKTKIAELTYHDVVFFQLRHLSLPDAYEREIENTEVKGQDILKASAELDRAYVKFNTTVIIASLEVNATKETAKGDAGKILHDARAYQQTILPVSEA